VGAMERGYIKETEIARKATLPIAIAVLDQSEGALTLQIPQSWWDNKKRRRRSEGSLKNSPCKPSSPKNSPRKTNFYVLQSSPIINRAPSNNSGMGSPRRISSLTFIETAGFLSGTPSPRSGVSPENKLPR